jgi:dUTP pyrophosphatase
MNITNDRAIYLDDTIDVLRLDKESILPVRAAPEESGADITPISLFKQLRPDTWLLGTGLAIKPPKGTYIDMVGRSSISKTPVFISNAVGVMDTTFRGEFLIAVTLKNSNDIATFDPKELINGLPLAQIVLRPLLIAKIREVTVLDETARGTGGFGSTDKVAPTVKAQTSVVHTIGEAVSDAADMVGDTLGEAVKGMGEVASGICEAIVD